MNGQIEPIVGRYVHVDIGGVMHRIYFEENGSGVPLVCLHTAGSDGRQWRHLLADEEFAKKFRIIAFDMPWHGKSNPPASWSGEEYRLTTARYTQTIRAFCQALALEKPVVMGCSIGGRIVLNLAIDHAAEFRALLATCAERNVAVQTIKSLARGPKLDDKQPWHTWYAPLSETSAIEQAVHWVLGNPQVFLNTPGDITLLPRVLAAAKKFQEAPSDAEMQTHLTVHGVTPLFV